MEYKIDSEIVFSFSTTYDKLLVKSIDDIIIDLNSDSEVGEDTTKLSGVSGDFISESEYFQG